MPSRRIKPRDCRRGRPTGAAGCYVCKFPFKENSNFKDSQNVTNVKLKSFALTLTPAFDYKYEWSL